MNHALFEILDTNVYRPTEASMGPWDPAHCHGGPVSALLARSLEHTDRGEVNWHLARITVELMRPVPVGVALHMTTNTERGGRKVSLVSASLFDGETEVARARGLRIRMTDLEIPAGTVRPTGTLARSVTDSVPAKIPSFEPDKISFATTSCEHRFAVSNWTELGPVQVWIRLLVPVVTGETPSGAQRAAAAADFGNGVSNVLPWEQYLFINPDLTVNLARPPQGEWIGMSTVTHTTDHGIGMAESALYDDLGPLGRSVQSLYLDTR
jgi:hypothetical protein